ncbi:hypothetical protein DXT89_11665 [Agrobacterium vitis]|uniref:Uncharacterized protein n=1 Tax=Agrobacterium vitis TaxID=373 RepID=A0A7J4X5N7_AGRVI|nr:hypothetical protein DXT89_11665 [Agrobacterium vitis]RCU55508.1 hypothetical protein ASB66_000610 [Agrobacterium vitis]
MQRVNIGTDVRDRQCNRRARLSLCAKPLKSRVSAMIHGGFSRDLSLSALCVVRKNAQSR